MNPNTTSRSMSRSLRGRVALGLTLLAAFACGDDNYLVVPPSQPNPPSGVAPPIETDRTRDNGLPGLVIEVLSLKGAASGGNFGVGDEIRVNFTCELDDGTPVLLDELDSGSIYVSGPTFNYQRVIERQQNLVDGSVRNKDGTWTYVLLPLPATYEPPYNDSPAWGPEDGEMTGQALLDGTYTVGIEAYKLYTIEGQEYRDPANVVADFLFGNAAAIDVRDVVTQANCNECHSDLQVHGTFRREVRVCVLCHTSGSEDASGTGVSIDFRVMIHKIHNGAHLPSVLGVSTDSSGNRVYDPSAGTRYVVEGRSAHDYSDVAFPVWPNLSYGMPRDVGYEAAGRGSALQNAENVILTGVTACAKCHGDPDGSGPAVPPAQGDNAFTEPTRRACGSCHDDINWDHAYKANNLIMPPMANDDLCIHCHAGAGSLFPSREVHQHPLLDPTVTPGTNFGITAIREQTPSGNGKLDIGEVVEVDLDVTDGQGQPLDPSKLTRIEFAVTGPTWNRNILANESFPVVKLTGPSVTTTLPEPVYLELPTPPLSNGVAGEVFQTARMPHWNVSQADTQVFVNTGLESSTFISQAANEWQNFIDVDEASGFEDDDYIVVGLNMGRPEYLRVQWADKTNNRLWFSSSQGAYASASSRYQPWLRIDHPPGDDVSEATMVEQTAYTVEDSSGTITTTAGFDAGIAVISYVTDFVIPAKYMGSLNDSPDLGHDWAEWTGLDVLDGTYTAGIWGEQIFTVTVDTEKTSYNAVSSPATVDFLVGPTATTLQPNDIISSAQNCYSCHDDLWFHGSHRRGYETCVMCHGNAGGEDGPNYVWPAGAPTPGVGIEFRSMLHKIHMGEDLTNASTYAVAGFNGSPHFYDKVVFPAQPGGVQQCAKCHGTSDAWELPADRNHPTTNNARSWMVVCGSCHDSSAAAAHFNTQTVPNGPEACATCHSKSDELNVERMHRSW